ncbi:MAG TPA: class I SAM-dependent methyltransferase [Salinivirga sp.]|uniref:class I SAM-dependent methyltransferase n=1 Tax=Salinivirga sp. TaxID=1970192 RepID=UPI002B483824|nr:class I SAM-dependent methyltransferase [Salinivirga sp.]HKK57933.1 class I SAM-dependent methyltransferase [Salinivirga sp.]
MTKIVEKFAELPKPLRKPLWQWWHRKMNKYDRDNAANFMNYGFESLNGDARLELNDEDETDRYCIQLYDHVVNQADLKGKKVLEVGSGRGGGASYISRYYKPESYIGMDISESSISFCNKHYNVDNLSFVHGIAESIPYEDNSFDCIVNVESARCYGNMQAFFNEVYRVLRPGGKLLLADMIYPSELENFNKRIDKAGFKRHSEKNISSNVVAGLDKDSERREHLIDAKIPRFLRKSFKTFAGTIGTSRYQNFANGTFQYWSYVLEK